jgi:hypothetical protein
MDYDELIATIEDLELRALVCTTLKLSDEEAENFMIAPAPMSYTAKLVREELNRKMPGMLITEDDLRLAVAITAYGIRMYQQGYGHGGNL